MQPFHASLFLLDLPLNTLLPSICLALCPLKQPPFNTKMSKTCVGASSVNDVGEAGCQYEEEFNQILFCYPVQLKVDQRPQWKIRNSENDKGKLEQNPSMYKYRQGNCAKDSSSQRRAGTDNRGYVRLNSSRTAKETICRVETVYTIGENLSQATSSVHVLPRLISHQTQFHRS